jgi:hypothetical protein
MRPLLRPLTAAVALLAALPAAAAQSVLLLPATGANIHAGHLAGATDVLRVYLEKAGYAVTLGSAAAAAGQEPTPAQAGEAAAQAGASLAVTLRLARLGANAVARIAAVLPDGRVVRTDELTAGSPEDLDPVLRRLALSVATGRSAQELAELDTVTEREADPFLKYVATHMLGIKLGAYFPQDRADPKLASVSMNGGGIFWMYDARWYLAEVSLDLQSADEDTLVAIGIGAYYPFTRGHVAPYVGGGIAYTWADHGGTAGEGIAFRAGGGVIVGRLSTVQFRIDGGVWIDAFPVTETVSGEEHYTWGPQVSLGLAF